jgi:hypothetical protein
MHPPLVYYLGQARTAELHQRAQRDAQAQAAGRASRTRIPRRRHRARGLPATVARRVRTVLGDSS